MCAGLVQQRAPEFATRRASFSFLFLASLELSDIKVFGPQTRALLGTASHFCEEVVLVS